MFLFSASPYIKVGSSSSVENITCSTTSANRFRVLVIYVFADNNSLSKPNLEFFIRVTVNRIDDDDYYFTLQQVNKTYMSKTNLPELPSNGHYVQHENKCLDLRTIGWFLSNHSINITAYKYFLFLNFSGNLSHLAILNLKI